MKVLRLLVLFMLALLVSAVVPVMTVGPVSAASLPVVSIRPLWYRATKGNVFNVSIYVSDASNVRTWGFSLRWNKDVLNITDMQFVPIAGVSNSWLYIYRDADTDGSVSAGDTRLTAVPWPGGGGTYAVNSVVAGGDLDEGSLIYNFMSNEKFRDTTVNGIYNSGEMMYRDVDGSGTVTAGDIRLRNTATYVSGSTVAAGDTDASGSPALTAFNSDEKHTKYQTFFEGTFLTPNSPEGTFFQVNYPGYPQLKDAFDAFCAKNGAYAGNDGDGLLMKVTFIVLNPGNTALDLYDTSLVDPAASQIKHTTIGVGILDLTRVAIYYGTTDARGDVDGDGGTNDIADLALVARYYGHSALAYGK